MIRSVLGPVIALAGATAAVLSPFLAWYEGRHGSRIRAWDLVTGLTAHKAAVLGSILLPLAVAALLTLVGLIVRSRVLVIAAGVLALAVPILWGARQYETAAGLNSRSTGSGVALALLGAALILLGAVVTPSRPGSGRHRGPGRRQHPLPERTGPPDTV